MNDVELFWLLVESVYDIIMLKRNTNDVIQIGMTNSSLDLSLENKGY